MYVGDHRVFIYSGEVKDSHTHPMVNTDDTWIYHTRRKTWERVAEDHAPPGRRPAGESQRRAEEMTGAIGAAPALCIGLRCRDAPSRSSPRRS